MKGKMTISVEVDIVFFNFKLIQYLDIILNITMPHNLVTEKIIVPSIITYENTPPQSLTIIFQQTWVRKKSNRAKSNETIIINSMSKDFDYTIDGKKIYWIETIL